MESGAKPNSVDLLKKLQQKKKKAPAPVTNSNSNIAASISTVPKRKSLNVQSSLTELQSPDHTMANQDQGGSGSALNTSPLETSSVSQQQTQQKTQTETSSTNAPILSATSQTTISQISPAQGTTSFPSTAPTSTPITTSQTEGETLLLAVQTRDTIPEVKEKEAASIANISSSVTATNTENSSPPASPPNDKRSSLTHLSMIVPPVIAETVHQDPKEDVKQIATTQQPANNTESIIKQEYESRISQLQQNYSRLEIEQAHKLASLQSECEQRILAMQQDHGKKLLELQHESDSRVLAMKQEFDSKILTVTQENEGKLTAQRIESENKVAAISNKMPVLIKDYESKLVDLQKEHGDYVLDLKRDSEIKLSQLMKDNMNRISNILKENEVRVSTVQREKLELAEQLQLFDIERQQLEDKISRVKEETWHEFDARLKERTESAILAERQSMLKDVNKDLQNLKLALDSKSQEIKELKDYYESEIERYKTEYDTQRTIVDSHETTIKFLRKKVEQTEETARHSAPPISDVTIRQYEELNRKYQQLKTENDNLKNASALIRNIESKPTQVPAHRFPFDQNHKEVIFDYVEHDVSLDNLTSNKTSNQSDNHIQQQEHWRTQYVKSCQKITDLSREKMSLLGEIERLRAKKYNEPDCLQCIQLRRHLDSIRFERDALEKKNKNLVRVITKMATGNTLPGSEGLPTEEGVESMPAPPGSSRNGDLTSSHRRQFHGL